MEKNEANLNCLSVHSWFTWDSGWDDNDVAVLEGVVKGSGLELSLVVDGVVTSFEMQIK